MNSAFQGIVEREKKKESKKKVHESPDWQPAVELSTIILKKKKRNQGEITGLTSRSDKQSLELDL